MNRRLALLASGVLTSAAVAVAADVPAVPHPVGAPVVYAVTPNTGSTSGATPVVIFGNDFNGATSVKFGSTPATRFFALNRRIFVRSPSGTAGAVVDVTVTTPLGTSAISLADQYTYAVVPPVVDASDPRQGTAAGGTRVDIHGHGLWGATAISFGGVTIPCFLAPAAASALPSTTGGGKLPLTSREMWTEFDRTLAAAAPTPSPTLPRYAGAGATRVGGNFGAPTLPRNAGAGMRRGGNLYAPTLPSPRGGGNLDAGQCMQFGDDSDLFVLSPTGTASATPIDIQVITGVATSAAGPGTKFTFVAPVTPVVNAIGPGHGSANGGTNVQLLGSGFSGATTVNFGPNAVQVCAGGFGGPGPGQCFFPTGDDTRIFLQSPAGAIGTVDVTVTTPAATSGTSQATKYTNDPPGPPQVDAVTANHGSALGGGNVHIQGSALAGATAVKFGSTPVSPCGPSTQAMCFSPGGDTDLFVYHAPGGTANTTTDVTVTTPLGTSATSAATKFTFDVATAPVIQVMDPNHGLVNGGTNVNLFGKGFGSATSLTIGAVTMPPCPPPNPGPCFGVGNDNNITFGTPGNPAGAPPVVAVTVTNAAGTSLPVNFTYDLPVALSITSVSPNTGPTTGNFPIWLTGTGFNETSQVTFDTGTASYVGGFFVPYGSDSTLQVWTPQVPPGTTLVDVVVHRPSGPSPTTMSDHFTFTPVTAVIPTVSAVTPSTAPNNSTVEIYGSGFSMASKVVFGTVQVFGFFVPNDHLIVMSSPPAGPGATGTVPIYVTTPAGTNTTGAMFTYGSPQGLTQVGGLDPFQATQLGGANMNIYGVGFNFATSVSFGNTTLSPCNFGGPGACFTVNTENYIYVNTPPQGTNPAQVDVRVTGGPLPAGTGNTSPIVAADKFTFVAPVTPAVNAVDPQQASTFGGTPLTIYGSGFSGATSVKVGPNVFAPCGPNGFGGFRSCFSIFGDTMIGAPTVPTSPGTVEIQVTAPTGTSALNAPADQLTYVMPGPPAITGVIPGSGPSSGGTVAYVIGTNLQGGNVSFGQSPAFNIQQFFNTPTLLTVVSPPGSAGMVPVTVTTPSGSAGGGQFTYIQRPAPSITSVSPNHGMADGPTQVLITGTDLGGATAVRFGSMNAFNFFDNFDFFSQSPGPLQVSSPPGPGGTTVDISVTTTAGTSAPVAADQFTFAVQGVPVVNALSPNTGATEGDKFFISGTNLGFATGLNFGTNSVSGMYFFPVAPGVLEAFSPPGTPGTVDVTVTNAAGTSTTSANTKYTYVTTPRSVVGAISPTHGPPGTPVLISGTSMELNKMGDVVKFGTAVPDFFGQNDTGVILANSPPPPPGSATVDITVTNDGGTSATSAADLYTFDPALGPPTVTIIAPDSAPAGAGVAITGTNLGGTTEVDFGTDVASSIFVRSDTLVIAFSPCDNGVVNVTVKTAAGTATSPNKFKFQRCRGTAPAGGANTDRTSNPPPLAPGPPPGPRGLQSLQFSSPFGGRQGEGTLSQVDAQVPTVTTSIDAIWLRLRAMSALVGGP